MKKLWIILVATIIVSLGTAALTSAAVIRGGAGGDTPTTQADYVRLYSYKCPHGFLCLFDGFYFNGPRVKWSAGELKDGIIGQSCPSTIESKAVFNDKASSIINKTGCMVDLYRDVNCGGLRGDNQYGDSSVRMTINKNAYAANLSFVQYNFINHGPTSNNQISSAMIDFHSRTRIVCN